MQKDPSKVIATTVLQKNVIYRLFQPIQPCIFPSAPYPPQQILTAPCISWHSSNLIAFSVPIPPDAPGLTHSIPNNSCEIHILSPQAPWDLMPVRIPEHSGQVIDLLWTPGSSLFVLFQDGTLSHGEMDQHLVNKWHWERVQGLSYRDQLTLLRVVESSLDDDMGGALLGLTQTGELTVTKKMDGLSSPDIKLNIASLNPFIEAISGATDFLDSGWTILRGRVSLTQGVPLSAALGRSETHGLCIYILTESGFLSVYRLVASFSPSVLDRQLSQELLLSRKLSISGNSPLKLLLLDSSSFPSDLLVCSSSQNNLQLSTFKPDTSEGELLPLTTVTTNIVLPSLPPLMLANSFRLVPPATPQEPHPSLLFLSPVGELYAVHISSGESLLSRTLPQDQPGHQQEQKNPGSKYPKVDSQSSWPALSISPNHCLAALLDLSSPSLHLVNLGLSTPPDSTLSGPSLMAQLFWSCLLEERTHWDLLITAGIRGEKDILPLLSELEGRFQAELPEFQEIFRPKFLAMLATLHSTLLSGYYQVCSLHNQIRILFTGQYLRTLLGPNSHSYPTESWPSHQLRKQLDSSLETDLNSIIDDIETKEFTGDGGMNLKSELVFIVDQALLALNEVIGPMATFATLSPRDVFIWKEIRELLVLVGIWSKLYPRVAPFSSKPETQDLLPHLFIAVSRVLLSIQAGKELVSTEILDGLQLPLNDPPIFTSTAAPQLQTLTWGISSEELPQVYHQARSPSIAQNILPSLNILDPISLLLLAVPRKLSPPWIGEITASQTDLINHVKLERKHWEEGLRQCTNCRKFTQCLSQNHTRSEEVVILKQSWNKSCFCGGLWKRVDPSTLDISRFDSLF